MIRWYLRLARTHALTAVLLLVGSAAAISVAARVTLGARGTLVPIVLYFGFFGALIGIVGRLLLAGAMKDGLASTNSRIVLGVASFPLAFAAFIGWQVLLLLLDLAFPFDEVAANVVAWHYEYAGRGPGSEHLRLADGTDLEMPPLDFYAGPRVPGRYLLEITRFQRLVVDAKPLR